MSTKSKPAARAETAGESIATAAVDASVDQTATVHQTTTSDQAPTVEAPSVAALAVEETASDQAVTSDQDSGATKAARPEQAAGKPVDPVTRTAGTTARCLEAINAEMLSFTQQSIAAGVATGRAMLEVRSMQDVLALQGAYARATVDRFVNHSTKLNGVLLGAAREALQPFGGGLFPFGGRAS